MVTALNHCKHFIVSINYSYNLKSFNNLTLYVSSNFIRHNNNIYFIYKRYNNAALNNRSVNLVMKDNFETIYE